MQKQRDKIRILHFARIVSRNDFLDSVISNLNPEQFDVYVATFQDTSLTFSPVFKEKGITHFNLDVANARNVIRIVPALSKIIRQNKIEIFHSHLFEESLIGGLLKFLHPKVKFVLGRHYSDEIYLLHEGFKRNAWLAIEGFANKMADKIVAGSSMVKDILQKQKVNPDKIAFIPYGFEFSDYRYGKNSETQTANIRRRYRVNDSDLLLVNIGRLFHLKGQSLLLDVFADLVKQHSNIKLLIIGDGPDRQMLEDKVTLLQLQEKVQFTGWLKDAHTYISAAEMVVHPTLSEMFSQLMIETMALGKPLIINDVSAVRDVISDRINGLICQHKYKDWRAAIELLINDAPLRKQLGENAERHVKQRYAIQNVIKEYEALYIKLKANVY